MIFTFTLHLHLVHQYCPARPSALAWPSTVALLAFTVISQCYRNSCAISQKSFYPTVTKALCDYSLFLDRPFVWPTGLQLAARPFILIIFYTLAFGPPGLQDFWPSGGRLALSWPLLDFITIHCVYTVLAIQMAAWPLAGHQSILFL